MYEIGIDIGGTFTDVTAIDPATGHRWTAKVPSTPSNPAEAFMTAVRTAAADAAFDTRQVTRIFHGTTVATNAILEARSVTRVGLITTRGFRYVSEVGRHDTPDNYFGWVKPERPAPPDFIEEVEERLDIRGRVLAPLNEGQVVEAAHKLADQGVEAIAIAFLYSFLDPTHERRAAELVAVEYPDMLIALSSDILPAFREFERTMATALSATVMPHVSRYVSSLMSSMQPVCPEAHLYIMRSNGGLASASIAAKQALGLVLSGPSAGVVGAAAIGKMAGFTNVITADAGGTSTDVALIRSGEAGSTYDQMIAGLPVSIPMIDVHAVGAGGGSIAEVSGLGTLRVGPRSAGADPGPACYGRGGREPTVSDAQLSLGRLPSRLAGGRVALDRDASVGAIETNLAHPLEMSWEAAAEGVIQIAVRNMAAGIRRISVERGWDPREFVLLAFGGAGPTHAADLAKELQMGTVLIPPAPGVLSTWGLLDTDLRSDLIKTLVDDSPEVIQAAFNALESEAQEWLKQEGADPNDVKISRMLDCRYPHQGAEITVTFGARAVSPESVDAARQRFHAEHLRLNTFNLPELPVEVVNVRLQVEVRIPRSPFAFKPKPGASIEHALKETREVYFGSWREVSVYDRALLPVGEPIVGPAIIEQDDTTTVVPPGVTAQTDRHGNLLMKLERTDA